MKKKGAWRVCWYGWNLMIGLAILSCRPKEETTMFELLDSSRTSITFTNSLYSDDRLNILDYLYFYNGAGVSTGDINNDGLADLYFVSNQGKNKLYLNKGGFTFEDITDKAGVAGNAHWQTGVTMADINGDGLLDIYVCAVGNFKALEGSNELYINNGDLTFTESAAEYGLDFTGFSTQATFFDYDRDGDLDMYLLNHAVHTSRSYGRVSARVLKHHEAGDYLFQNPLISAGQSDEKASRKFVDVSKKAGIYQAAMGYGLGVVVSDINQDGWDDIYVSNDFHEDDYYYVNQRDGTFREEVRDHFKHLSRFSMGCDAADINNDGYTDLMTLDMYPEDEVIEKSSAGEDPFDIFIYKLQFGYYNQYSRNCLQLNAGEGKAFSDIALMANVAATDWSWSTLLADYDNDGLKDIFVTNGIARRPNDLDYVKYISNDSVTYGADTPEMKQKSLLLMPEGKVHNYLFKGVDGMHFEDKSMAWGFERPNISNGAVYVDLDNDGDLDLVSNNIDEPAGVYQNHTRETLKKNYLKIKFEGPRGNNFGLGAKVAILHNGTRQYQQVTATRGFESSVEPTLFFGLDTLTNVDTLLVWWPDDKVEIKTNLAVNMTITLRHLDTKLSGNTFYNIVFPSSKPILSEVKNVLDFVHRENGFHDLYRQPLSPFEVSAEGPALAIGDVNGDMREDVYVGGAKLQSGSPMIQQADGSFRQHPVAAFLQDSVYEDVDAVFFDADGDHDQDLYVVSGGNEFYGEMVQQFDRLYLNDGVGNFIRSNGLPPMYTNKSCVRPCDFDGDGDLDLFVGGRVTGYQYGITPPSFLLQNDGHGNFTDITSTHSQDLQYAGMITDAVWTDADGDHDNDLVVAGEWMPITVFTNDRGRFTKADAGLDGASGFWQCLSKGDFDGDGDEDLVAGNLGTNSKLRKMSARLRMYVKDMDNNNALEHILAYERSGQWFPVATKDELAKQLPAIRKKFTDYKRYAGKTVEEIFGNDLQDAVVKEVNTFGSVLLENDGHGKYAVRNLPPQAQVSKVMACYVDDLTGDGIPDLILGGNDYEVSMYQGRYDASYGVLLQGTGQGGFTTVWPLAKSGLRLDGQVRAIKPVIINKRKLILVARNNNSLQTFEVK